MDKKSKEAKTINNEDRFEDIYKAIGAITKDCEKTRNSASISVSKCYAANEALVELLIEKGVLANKDREVFLLKSLHLFHSSSLKDICAALDELESGRSITTEDVVSGLKEEKEYHEEIVAQIEQGYSSVESGEKTYLEFIAELSAYLNDRFDLK